MRYIGMGRHLGEGIQKGPENYHPKGRKKGFKGEHRQGRWGGERESAGGLNKSKGKSVKFKRWQSRLEKTANHTALSGNVEGTAEGLLWVGKNPSERLKDRGKTHGKFVQSGIGPQVSKDGDVFQNEKPSRGREVTW